MEHIFRSMNSSLAAPETLLDAIRYFADPDISLAFVVELRWPDGVMCVACESKNVSFLKTRRIWKCRECHRQFSAKLGTIFEDSPIAFDKWLPALWMLANCKNGISSYELARALGVTQKTAWFMLSRIRLAMQTRTFEKMRGDVEIDETFIGGKGRFMHASKRARLRGTGVVDKVAVIGLLERKRGAKHSIVRASVVASTKRRDLEPHVHANVRRGANVYTDANKSYARLQGSFVHAAVDHAVKYAEGKVHTNGLENFWSLLKRSIKGTYVSVDPIHLFRYVDEQTYRFNEREKNDLQRFVGVLRDVIGKRLTYAELISTDMLPATT